MQCVVLLNIIITCRKSNCMSCSMFTCALLLKLHPFCCGDYSQLQYGPLLTHAIPNHCQLTIYYAPFCVSPYMNT